VTLVLARHGETAYNAERRLVGRADPPLTARGRRQAEAIGTALAGATAVVASPLRRAQETAATIGAHVRTDERWMEADYGELDGLLVVDAWQALWERWQVDPDYAPPGGEPLSALGRRVRAACEDLLGEAATTDLVVVTHVGPIKAAVVWALAVGDTAAWRMFCDVASITRVDVGDRGPALRAFNDTCHLTAIEAEAGAAGG
jgi:broad specificity phosphatase PhoE